MIEPISTTVISSAERDAYQDASYRVLTVTPLVEDPQRREFVMTQERLDEYLEHYNEFAEFIVSVERIQPS